MIIPQINKNVTLWWTYKKLWKITIFSGKIHYKWPFSIATLNYQRVLKPPEMMDSFHPFGNDLNIFLIRVHQSKNICLQSGQYDRSSKPRSQFHGLHRCRLAGMPVICCWNSHAGAIRSHHQAQKTQPNTKVEHPLNHTQCRIPTKSYHSRKTYRKTINKNNQSCWVRKLPTYLA